MHGTRPQSASEQKRPLAPGERASPAPMPFWGQRGAQGARRAHSAMPIVPIRTICREEKQSFLTHLGISVTRSHLGQLQVHLSDPPEHTVSTSEPVAPLSEGNGNDEGYIFRGRKTLKADGYHRYQTTHGNAVCAFKWVNSSSNLLWICPTTPNPSPDLGGECDPVC